MGLGPEPLVCTEAETPEAYGGGCWGARGGDVGGVIVAICSGGRDGGVGT
jgi:hypothetical protein